MLGTSNILQWNPSGSNMEPDSTYAADTQRSGGATTAAIFGSPVGNKLFYQVSTVCAAFCAMMAAKGYTISDSSLSALTAVMMNVKTSADFPSSILSIAYATSVTFDATASEGFDLILTGNVSASTLTGTSPGQLLTFVFAQDATGGRTFAWPTNVIAPGAVCPFASSVSIQVFKVRAGGTIIPVAPMLWISAAGAIIPQSAAVVVSVNSSGTVASGFSEITEKVDASGGAITRTLYAGIAAHTGLKVNVKKMDSSINSVTIAGAGSQGIDGFPSITIFRQSDSITVQFDGANWIII